MSRFSNLKRALCASAAVLVSGLTAASPASAATPAAGWATTSNVLLGLTIGNTSASAGIDRASSTLDKTRAATAMIDLVSAGSTTLSAGARSYATDGSGTSPLGLGPVSLPGLGAATVSGGSIRTTVASDNVWAAADLSLTEASLGDGLVTIGSAQSSSNAVASAAQAAATRTLSLADADVLSVRRFLQLIGVDPKTLDCAGIEAAGLSLGVATSSACAVASSIQADLATGQSALSSAQSTLQSDRQTIQATAAGVTLVDSSLSAIASTYGVALTAGTILGPGQRTAILDEISARLAAINGSLSTIAAQTCGAGASAFASGAAAVPSLTASLAPLAASLADACSDMQSLLDGLLDTSLLSVDTFTVSLSAVASQSAPVADGTGTLGVVRLGNRTVAVAGLSSGSAALAATTLQVRAQLSQALTALGVGAFPLPDLDFAKVTSAAGRNTDGSAFARSRVAGLHFALPAVSLSAPSGTPAGRALASSGSSPVRAAAAAPAASPAISLDAMSFSAESRYYPAASDPTCTECGIARTPTGTLTATGSQSDTYVFAGLLVLFAGLALRRLGRAI